MIDSVMHFFGNVSGLVMDYNPKHFPTVLTACIISAMLAYIISHIVYYFHQRNGVNHAQNQPSPTEEKF